MRECLSRGSAPLMETGQSSRGATAAPTQAAIVGHVQEGRRGLELTASHSTWNKTTAPEPRRTVAEEVRRQEEAARWAKAVSLGKQGQWEGEGRSAGRTCGAWKRDDFASSAQLHVTPFQHQRACISGGVKIQAVLPAPSQHPSNTHSGGVRIAIFCEGAIR